MGLPKPKSIPYRDRHKRSERDDADEVLRSADPEYNTRSDQVKRVMMVAVLDYGARVGAVKSPDRVQTEGTPESPENTRIYWPDSASGRTGRTDFVHMFRRRKKELKGVWEDIPWNIIGNDEKDSKQIRERVEGQMKDMDLMSLISGNARGSKRHARLIH